MTRNLNRRQLAAALALVALAGCSSTTEPTPQVGEVGAALGAGGGHGDGWKFHNRRGERHERNFCPLVSALASPAAVKVGKKTKAHGFAFDFDRRPQRLTYAWTAKPASAGTFDDPTAKHTKFLCEEPGRVKLVFKANDGDCTRKAVAWVYCKPTTQPVCGNGVTEGNETCDGDCPTSCDDGKACTTDTLTGSPDQCNVACSHSPITTCGGDADSCCPASCNSDNDVDCEPSNPVCGNGVLDSGETCDDTSDTKCPASCDDGNPCTTDVRTGAPETCDVVCAHNAITQCSDTGDTCCPSGCNANNDADCEPSCGNGVKEMGETCDPQSTCPTSCPDDGNACTVETLSGSAADCDAACTTTSITTCTGGDGCCAPGCDYTNDSDCAPPPPHCGNGVLDSGETCDDSSSTPCPASCDDGVACTTDSSTGAADTCDLVCHNDDILVCSGEQDGCCNVDAGCNANNDYDCAPVCGNGVVEDPELCDDGVGSTKPCPTSCDDGDPCTEDGQTGSAAECNLVCSHTPITTPECLCGNGTLDDGETCDGDCPTSCNDGNACTQDTLTGQADLCNVKCEYTPISTPECLCGNGTLDSGETCDDTSGTPCPTSCDPSSDACTQVSLTGSPDMCNVKCDSTPRACGTDGDSCCPSGCTSDQDNDCQGNACSDCKTDPNNAAFCQPGGGFAACSDLTGNTASDSPLQPNTPRAQLCQQIVDCMESMHCAQTASLDCLCGPGADPNTCFNGTFDAMSGACRDLMAAGMETTNVTDMAQRVSDTNFATGVAVSVIETCDQIFCPMCL